ncbi:MAG TPA: AAA family ATPase, partial [Terriglobales bacterium]|nr:AAA family ATPase [Terriglobales bacterium]
MVAGRPPSPDAFVGRARELANLRGGLDSAVGGRGRLVLLVGEPGIGKTRLADEISALAPAHGALALWGRSWESGGAPPFWPWTQLIRALISHHRRLGRPAPDLPAPLAALLANRPTQPAAEPEQARFQLFTAVGDVLADAAAEQPLVLVLDDLHAADLSSLLLLRFLARDLRTQPWLMVGTYRDVEAAAQPAIATLLAEIAREGERLALGGLSRSETAAYIGAATAAQPKDGTVDAVHHITEGNPLFLTEVARLLGSGCDPDRLRTAIPDEIRTAIRQRLSALSSAARRLLTIAAVIGRDVDRTVLEHLAAAELGENLLPLLDEVKRANALIEAPDGNYRFAHLLVRDTLYEAAGSSERAALHRRAGEALEQLTRMAPTAHLAEMAHHFAEAAGAGEAVEAVHYCQRAGDHALTLLAYEEAARHYRRALACLELRPQDSTRHAEQRCQLLLSLGDAQWGAGELAAMRATFQAAAQTAEALPPQQRGALLARAALGLGGRQQRAHVAYDAAVVTLLEAAEATLPRHDSALRARVLARLAYALYAQPGSATRRQALCREAVAMARRAGDPHTLRWVLNDWRWALWGPDNLADRLRIADELIGMAERLGDRELLLTEHAWRLVDHLELGDIAAVRAELQVFTELADEIRLPWYHWYVSRFAALLATLEGRFAEAERLAADGLATAQRVQHQDSFLIYATQMMTVRVEQGRFDELETGLQGLVAQYPAVPVWRYLLAYLHAEQGWTAQTRQELDRIAGNDFVDVPDDYLRLPNLAYLAEVVAFLGDR